MPKLFLVGITPDHRALVLSEHARAKRGDMVLEIDDRLLEAIDKAQRLRAFDEGHRLESAALPSKRELNGDGTERARLTPREIQQRLRAGESIAALARSSGTDEAWIRRFAAPVLAEQAKIIERARALTFTRRGAGPSAVSLGPAVAANVIDRGVPLTLPDLEAGWGAYQRPEGGWHVTFTFPLRGRRQTAEWEIDLATGDLTARNKLASELGWREIGKKLPQPKPVKTAAPKRAAARPEATADAPPTEAATADAATGSAVSVTPATEAPAADPEASDDSAADASLTPESDGGRKEPEAAQVLPLNDEAPTPSPEAPVRKAPSARKAPATARKAPASKTPARKPTPAAKRTAAAMTEAPAAQSTVPVSPTGAEPEAARPADSMPPTDLDVVDVAAGFPSPEDDERETVIILPPSPEDDQPVSPTASSSTVAGP